MNRRTLLRAVAVVPLGFVTTKLVGCRMPGGGTGISAHRVSDCAIGVFETRDNVADSRIIFYDAELNYVGDLRLPYATLGMNFQLPVTFDNRLYVVPQGLMGKRDERLVLSLPLDDLSLNKYHVDQTAIYGVACNDKHLYTCSNLNWSSYIGRNDLADQSIYKEIELPGVCVDSIIAVGDRLYAFAWKMDSPTRQTLLQVYSDSLELIDIVDISVCGRGQYRPRAYNGAIYFASWSGADDDELGSTVLGVFDVEALELRTYDLGDELLDVIPDGSGAYALCGNMWASRGTPTKVSRFDLANLGNNATITIDDTLRHAVVRKDKLYAVSDDRIYLVETDDGLRERSSRGLSSMGGEYSYYSGMFSF